MRRGQDRFTAENLERNLTLLTRIRTLAAELEITPAQLARAWLLAQGQRVVPIAGTKHPDRAAENAAAAQIEAHARANPTARSARSARRVERPTRDIRRVHRDAGVASPDLSHR